MRRTLDLTAYMQLISVSDSSDQPDTTIVLSASCWELVTNYLLSYTEYIHAYLYSDALAAPAQTFYAETPFNLLSPPSVHPFIRSPIRPSGHVRPNTTGPLQRPLVSSLLTRFRPISTRSAASTSTLWRRVFCTWKCPLGDPQTGHPDAFVTSPIILSTG